MNQNTITIHGNRLVRLMASAFFLLLLLHTATLFSIFVLGYDYLKGFVPLFNFNREQNIPTLFSVFVLLIASLLLLIVAICEIKQQAPYRIHWTLLSIGFFLMGLDEGMSFHELLTTPSRQLVSGEDTAGIFYYAWVVPGLIAVLLLGLFFLKFLLNLPQPTRSQFVIAATLYLTGALGCELAGGYYAEKLGGENFPIYAAFSTLEECLEMLGVIFFIRAILAFIATHHQEIHLNFSETNHQ